jgi:hypothetical protein
LIPSQFPFEAGRLRRAFSATFGARGTHALLSALPPPPAEWRPAYRRMAAEVDLDLELSDGYEQAQSFLDPILSGRIPDDASWDPTRPAWN